MNYELLTEIEYLKTVIAYEARVIEAQTLDLKSLAKSRRSVLEESVAAMRAVVTTGQTLRYGYPARRELENLRREFAAASVQGETDQ